MSMDHNRGLVNLTTQFIGLSQRHNPQQVWLDFGLILDDMSLKLDHVEDATGSRRRVLAHDDGVAREHVPPVPELEPVPPQPDDQAVTVRVQPHGPPPHPTRAAVRPRREIDLDPPVTVGANEECPWRPAPVLPPQDQGRPRRMRA